MVKAMKDGGYADIGCFAHTVQVIVHEGVLARDWLKIQFLSAAKLLAISSIRH